MLTLEGELNAPRTLDPLDLRRLPSQIEDVSAIIPGREGSAVWLRDVLEAPRAGELTVVWHSVMRQYVDPDEWADIERALADAAETMPLARLSMEPAGDRQARMQLTVHDPVGAAEIRLALCDDHGLPIRWAT